MLPSRVVLASVRTVASMAPLVCIATARRGRLLPDEALLAPPGGAPAALARRRHAPPNSPPRCYRGTDVIHRGRSRPAAAARR